MEQDSFHMRPSTLNPLFSSIHTIAGVGPKMTKLIAKIISKDNRDDPRIYDLLFTLPYTTIDRRKRSTINSLTNGIVATLKVKIDSHQTPSLTKRKIPYQVFAHDETGDIRLIFFHTQKDYLQKILLEKEWVLISGKIQIFHDKISMVHPDYILTEKEEHKLPSVEPIYSLTTGLSAKTLRRCIALASVYIPDMPEWHSSSIMQQCNFSSFRESLEKIHFPTAPTDSTPKGFFWRRLAYDEILANQISLLLVREHTKKLTSPALFKNQTMIHPLRENLPYLLTKSQEKALEEIDKDLSSAQPMLRLLQGDVGSGKTIVAIIAIVQVAENSKQSAFMAPTEILARQIFETIQKITKKIGLRIALLTAKESKKEKKKILQEIEEGSIDVVVGTHALFQEKVKFHDLSLVVIDEQHRFGVHQRLSLSAKGNATNTLVMTATPIPRTMTLTAFGDIDISILTEKPQGRKTIQTATLPLSRIDEIIQHVKKVVEKKEKIYWICPLVEESEHKHCISVTERFDQLQKILGNKIGLIHGKMDPTQKTEALENFKNGVIQILVATSIIEVGIDVPDASIIIIEHAEVFGLSQLHQLRGRVGRSEKQSFCVLLYKEPLNFIAKRRLSIMRETNDGFVIAEEDLKLRGQGEVLGTRQSGNPGFRIINLDIHQDLIYIARQEAHNILLNDPKLESERGKKIRLLLHLFSHNQAMSLLQAG